MPGVPGLLVVPVLLLSPILILGVLGLIWSPAAGAITAWLAHREGMPTLRAFGGGAVASIALFLPWCFLTANLLGWRSSDWITKVSYQLIIGLWFIFPFTLFILFYGLFVGFVIFITMVSGRGDIFALALVWAAIGIASGLLQCAMWNSERRWISGPRQWNDIYLPRRVTALSLRHLRPFIGALIWSAVAPLLLFACVIAIERVI